MPDSFSETTTTGYGGRIVNSIKGVVIGLILFVVSFGLLYWNEGRVDLSNIAKTATEISSATVSTDTSLSGKLISTTGSVSSDQTIGDNLFLNPDKFIAAEREVKMYSWIEKSESHSKTNTGGSETTETTYAYSKDWTENPKSSSNFKHPEGHENPQKSLDSYTNKATAATIGAYNFDPQSVTLPNFSQLLLNSQNVTLSGGATLVNDSYLFIKKSESGTFDSPQLGDLRISYHVLRPGFDGTIFGKLSGSKIDPYFDQDGNNLYRLFIGTRDQAISTLHTEYTTLLWILRLVGFLLMWFGLSALFGPISVILDFLPIFGAISRSLIGVITFAVAFVLTIVTILVSMLLHNLIALIIVLVITVGTIIAFFVMLKNKKAATIPVAVSTSLPLNQKSFANMILIVVIVALLGVTGYFVFVKKLKPITQQRLIPVPTSTSTSISKNEIAAWKTYTNSRIGYTFEYPQQMKVIDVFKYPNGNSMIPNEDQVDIQPIIINNAVPSGVDPHQYEIRVYMNERYNSIVDWIDKKNGHMVHGSDEKRYDLSQYQKITMGGQTAYKLVLPNEVYVITMVNGNIYTIYVANEPFSDSFDEDKYQTLQRLILSFQFPVGKPTKTAIPLNQPIEQIQSQNPEIIFAEKLSSCIKYKITFKHLLTKEILEKEILGIINGKCNYVEQTPNGGKMECKYSESERMAVAQLYKDMAEAVLSGKDWNIRVRLENGESKSTYTMNGKVIDNPLQEVMNNGSCVISGY